MESLVMLEINSIFKSAFELSMDLEIENQCCNNNDPQK